MNLISTLVVLQRKSKEVVGACVSDSAEVEEQLMEILADDANRVRQAYCILQTVISVQSRLRGPRNFRRLLDEIFQFIKIYSYDRIQAYQEQIVILNLTYYNKIFQFSFTLAQKIEVIVIFAIANIHAFLRSSDPKRLNSVQDKLNEANQLKIEGTYFINVLLLLNAIVTHLRFEHKRAKTLFANLLTKVINQKEQLKCPKSLEIMAICAFYSYLNLTAIGQYQLGCYYLTKASEFGRKLQNATRFVEKVKEIGEHKSYCVVKLTRIQNKLEVLKRTKSSWHSKTMKTKIYTQKVHHNENQAREELKNIFTIKDAKVTMYKLRKDNLRYLNGEQNKLTLNIKRKQDELIQIQKQRNNLGAGELISSLEKQINHIKQDRGQIKQEYEALKTKHLKGLKPVQIINRYLKTYVRLYQFRKCSYIYNFLYGKMFSRAKIFILSLFLKRRIRKVKRMAKKMKVELSGMMHFVEIFEIIDNETQFIIYKKKEVGFYLKIYPIEKKPGIIGIEEERKLEPAIFQRLMSVPFCYQFEAEEGRLLSWSEYFSRHNFLTIHYVKRFIHLLSKKCKNKQNAVFLRVVNVYLKFNSYVSVETKLFACCSQIQQHNVFLTTENKPIRFRGTMFTIGGPKYSNSMYNITINQPVLIDSSASIEQTGLLYVSQAFMKNCSKQVEAVKKIQKFMKLSFCKKRVKALKSKAKITVFVLGGDVITYCKYLMGKSFLIAENIFTKDREAMETIMDFNSFQEIVLIKDKLLKQKTCKDKLKLTCKYIWTRFFINKLKDHIKSVAVMTDFQVSFRNRIIFSKMFNTFVYKRKPVASKIVFSLTVESLLQFPRPYILRIFTVQQGLFIVDITAKIYNRDKLFYEKNLDSLNKIVNIMSRTQMEVMCESEQTEIQGARRRSTRMSLSSRGSRIKVTHSITNLSSDDQIKTSSVEAEIIPKITCKKTSMLARFRNRRSNQLARDQNMENPSNLFSHSNCTENKSDVSEIVSQN